MDAHKDLGVIALDDDGPEDQEQEDEGDVVRVTFLSSDASHHHLRIFSRTLATRIKRTILSRTWLT